MEAKHSRRHFEYKANEASLKVNDVLTDFNKVGDFNFREKLIFKKHAQDLRLSIWHLVVFAQIIM